MDFSGRLLLDFFPYSALFGSTVDACVCQSSEAWGLLVAMHLALCSFVVLRPWCAASWPVWTSRSSLCTGLA